MQTRILADKVRTELYELKQRAFEVDEQNKRIRSNEFVDREFFSEALFRCNSSKLLDHVMEAEANFNNLVKGGANWVYLNALGEKLINQISAINNAIKANDVIVKEFNYRKLRKAEHFEKRYKKTAKQYMSNSHELYQELTQNHEFERRLNEMIYMRQAQMQTADAPTQAQLQKEMLALHQRLGRCRKAITFVEERIQMAESKNRS